ncbi:MAG: DUF2283 domain-containing protein [Chloroflexota bacterium]
METIYDKDIDAIYIRFSNAPYSYGKDLDEERRIDYDINGEVRGVELHCISRGVNLNGLPESSKIAKLIKDINIKEYA